MTDFLVGLGLGIPIGLLAFWVWIDSRARRIKAQWARQQEGLASELLAMMHGAAPDAASLREASRALN